MTTDTTPKGYPPLPTRAYTDPDGVALHPRTADLVARFARALAEKLAAAELKYGYSDGWLSPDWMDECRYKLQEHVFKGDPRDVAAYCAFLWHHGASTARPIDEAETLFPARKQAAPSTESEDAGLSSWNRTCISKTSGNGAS